MSGWPDVLGSLGAVLVGALTSYLSISLSERRRWSRESEVRWDAERLRCYAEYGEAVKSIIATCHRLSAHTGVSVRVQPLPPEEALPLLAALESQRGQVWERLLLLGDPSTVEAARQWHSQVWELEKATREGLPADEWRSMFARLLIPRDAFYQTARASLGIRGVLPSAPARSKS